MTSVLDRKLQEALACFRDRDMGGVERSCREALRLAPGHPQAQHLLGHVFTSQGRLAEALEALSAAADAAPGDPAVHLDLGVALSCQNRHAEAAESFRRAVVLDPDNPGLHLNLGNALAGQGKAEEALACYRRALALNPGLAIAHYNIGKQNERMGRLGDAEAAYQSALLISPEHVDALHNLGTVYHRLGRMDAAAACYRKALELEPGHVQALHNLGKLLREQGQLAKAAWLHERAIESRPADPIAYINLGNVRSDQCRYAEAQALYRKALELSPDNGPAHISLGNALSAQHLWDEAVAQYERVLELDPVIPDAHYNLGLVRLFRHQFERGWPGYEHRLGCPDIRKGLRKGGETLNRYEHLFRWRGPGEAGVREVAIWAEQGIGDQILFSTLIPELVEAEVPFLYEVDARLLGAYERAFPGGRFVVLSNPPKPELLGAGRVLLAGSLPGLFRNSRADYARQPARLLGALPVRVAHYRERLDARGPGLKIALSWRSNSAAARMGSFKNAALMEFSPLLKLPGVQFIDVQYGDTLGERQWAEEATGARLEHFDEVDYYNDLEEMLAILEACDLVITTSNATAHFAGALGKRTWLLYPADRAPFYYWAHGGSYRSLWYPAVEIVTAPQLREWTPLLEHAATKLAHELT